MRLSLIARLEAGLGDIARATAGVFVIKAIGMALGLALSLALARTLGADGAGVFFLALSIATMASVLTRFGLDAVLLRCSAVYHSQSNMRELQAVCTKGISVPLFGSFFAALTLWFSAPAIAIGWLAEPALVEPLRLVAFSVPVLSLMALHIELLKGIRMISASQAISPMGLHALTLLGVTLLAGRYGVQGAVVAYVAALGVMAAVSIVLWSRSVPRRYVARSEVKLKSLLQDGFPLYIVAILALCGDHLPQLMLGALSDAEAVGTFAIANRIALTTLFVLVTINTVAAPRYASLYSSQDMAGLGKLSRDVTKLALLLTSPLLFVILVFPDALLTLFGSEFTEASTALMILTIGQLVNVATGSVAYLLVMTNHQAFLLYSTIVSATIIIVLCLLLIPSYSVLGAAVSCASGIAAQNLICTFFVWRRLNIVTIPVPAIARVAYRNSSL